MGKMYNLDVLYLSQIPANIGVCAPEMIWNARDFGGPLPFFYGEASLSKDLEIVDV